MAKKRKKKTAKAGKKPARRPAVKKAKTKKAAKKTKKTSASKSVRTAKKKTAARKMSSKDAMLERELEEGLMETFPASDPVALTDPTTSIKD